MLETVLATGASQTELARRCGLSQAHVSRLARGRSRRPTMDTTRALCAGLGIPYRLAGLADIGSEEETTDRRQILGASALAAAGTALPRALPGARPDADETLLMAPVAAYRRLERTTTSRLLVGPAVAHLGMLRRLAAVDAPRRLWAVISETAGLAAWLFIDCEDRAAAREHYRLAIEAAGRSGHALLPAYMWGSYAQFATWSGDTAQGVALARRARGELSRAAPPIALAWLDTIEAMARGFAGHVDALQLTDRAAARLTAADPVWPWLFRFDAAKVASYRALVAMRLRRTNDATEALAAAATLPQSPKQHAITTVEQAAMLAATGHLEQGCALAEQACEAGQRLGSERITRAVAGFRAGLPPGAARSTAVRSLDARLTAVYNSDRVGDLA